MTWVVNNARNALSGAASLVGSALSIPSSLLQAGAQRAWNALPLTNTAPVQNFLGDQSFTTRTAWKTGAVAAGVKALASTMPLTGLQVGTLAAVGLAATNITHKTGQGLPADPKAPLLETIQKILTFDVRRRPNTASRPTQSSTNPPSTATKTSDQTDREATDEQLRLFIHSASCSSTLKFIHSSRLGLDLNAKTMAKILQEAALPKQTLWSAYMKHAGKQLNWHQCLRASIWYFFSYTLGIVPNSIHVFMTNVLKELRGKLSDGHKISHLESGVNRLLSHTHLFLEAYNSAAKEYAEAIPPKGDIHFYRNEAIKRLGGVSLQQLCQEFSRTLIDEFFPRIPFFANLKKTRGVKWVFEVLDFLIGGFINGIGRWIIKRQLPSTLQSLIEEGLDPTSPSNLQFTVKVTQAVTEVLKDLETSGMTHKAPPPFEPKQLPAVIDQLFKALDLTGSKEEPLKTQAQVRERLKLYGPGVSAAKAWNQTKRYIFRNTLKDSGHTLITHVANHTEKIFAKALELSNQSLHSESTATMADYKCEYAKLEATADRALKKVVSTVLTGVSHGEQKRRFLEMYEEQHRSTSLSVQRFMNHATEILQAQQHNAPSVLTHSLNEYMQALKDFIDASSAMQADMSTPEIKNAFYASYDPLFQRLPILATQILHIQELQEQHVSQQGPALAQEVAKLQAETQRIQTIAGGLRPSSVESSFFLASAARGVAARAVTPIVMGLFERAYQFITTKDTYDAVGRVFMRSVVDTYQRRQ